MDLLPMPHCLLPCRYAGMLLPWAAAAWPPRPQGQQRRHCRRCRRPPMPAPLPEGPAACNAAHRVWGDIEDSAALRRGRKCSPSDEFSPQQRVPRQLPRHAAMQSPSSSDAYKTVESPPAAGSCCRRPCRQRGAWQRGNARGAPCCSASNIGPSPVSYIVYYKPGNGLMRLQLHTEYAC